MTKTFIQRPWLRFLKEWSWYLVFMYTNNYFRHVWTRSSLCVSVHVRAGGGGGGREGGGRGGGEEGGEGRGKGFCKAGFVILKVSQYADYYV